MFCQRNISRNKRIFKKTKIANFRNLNKEELYFTSEKEKKNMN